MDKSYTKFANKIGLSVNNELLRIDSQVVLNFPYKDCVLKGGQSKDEERSKEIFFNEILAHDEIDVLFVPKVLHKFELIGSNSSLTQDTRIADSTRLMKDSFRKNSPNLLIKGNNLIALHSLKNNPAIYGKVKIIYIDPPYNTGNDSFNYNDKFTHSAWLSFMKNRLEIAREFLRDDGVIFVQCDDNEQAYLKVLMDEIFGRENFIGCIVWLKGNAQNDAVNLQKNQEYILCYAKNIKTNPLYKIKQKVEVRAFKDDKSGRFYYEGAGLTMGGGDGGSLENRPNLGYTFYYNPQTQDIKPILDYDKDSVKTITNHEELYNDDKELIEQGYVPIRPPKMGAGNGCWKWALGKTLNEIDRILIKKSKNGYSVLRKEWLDSKKVKQDEKGFYAMIEKENPPKSFIDFVGSGVGSKENKAIFNAKVFNNPKPESLLKRIIELSTKEGDLVMDFFAGSGTTLAVAHKMNRKWVGVEQMDYIETITKARLEKVIAGEQGGVSKAVGWQGGGEFVYCELMPLNAVYKEQIIKAKNAVELESIYKYLQEKAFLDYRVVLQEMLKDKEFKELDLESKKEILKLALDSNMDYVPLGDIADSTYNISSEIIALNRAFYGKENE